MSSVLWYRKSVFKSIFLNSLDSVLDDNSENISQYFPATNAFIDQGRKEGCVLVHCVWGISRSAAFVIAYVMHNKLINFRAAFQLVHRARPIIAPNMGFRSQLQVYGFELLAVQFTIHYVTRLVSFAILLS